MALSIEQQRKYARMLSPEQLANYVKNEDLGNEIGITPVVFAEAIAEINAEDKELQPVAPNTVMDREVTEMLGRGGQGLEGLMPEEFMNPGMMPQEPMNPGMMPQQFNRGGIIPGYHSGGDIPTHAHGLNSDHRINEEPSEYYRKFLVSAPVDTRTTGDRVSGQGSPIISPSQDELDQWEKDKSERARSSTPRGTGVPPGWQPYVDLMQSGKIGEGWQRALEGSGPFTESPSFLERRNLGEKYFGLQSSSPVDQVTTTLDEMAKEQSGT